tara:strand:- start:790 stop:1035 length:246 start_codon:yes stop_codon:yes gene_type:complete
MIFLNEYYFCAETFMAGKPFNPIVSQIYMYTFICMFIYVVLNVFIAIVEEAFFAASDEMHAEVTAQAVSTHHAHHLHVRFL